MPSRPSHHEVHGDLTKFFPANQETFVERAGEVGCITTADLDDEHKRRHLESFQKSMTDWKAYEGRDEVIEESSKEFARHLLKGPEIRTSDELECAIKRIRKILKCNPNKAQLGAAIDAVCSEGPGTPQCPEVEKKRRSLNKLLLRRSVRTSSGVAVITVLTSPGKFSCPHDCWYCPNEPGQPRSYLSTEPAVLRGNQCHWDAAVQFWDRARTLHRNRHTVDKVEVLVLGGTWSGYRQEYQYDFCRDLFYAANEFMNLMATINYEAVDSYDHDELIKQVRPRLSLEEEQIINESAPVKIIGLTLETRPDYITKSEIKNFRAFGCTRVQLGVQHVDSAILNAVNRGHTIDAVRRALHLLKSSCYKVDIHLMPDLPNSTPILDQYMFDQVLRDCSLQADQWKIYPCEVTPFTKISEWYRDGLYMPYTEMKKFTPDPNQPGSNIFDCEATGEEVLIGLILQVKKSMHPWVRLNRVIRDIPNQSIIAGNSKTNLRQILEQIAHAHCWKCPCMRCREVRKKDWYAANAALVIRAYQDVDAVEYFLSFENQSRTTLYGFLRLRIPDFTKRECAPSDQYEISDIHQHRSTENDLPFDCLKKRTALIRELHVYGVLVGTEERNDVTDDSRTQHVGVGTALMYAAETLACMKGSNRVVIIAGVGTRNYYRKFGYTLQETYMVRDIESDLEKSSIFSRWSDGDNQLLGQNDRLTIEHIHLEELPSLRNVKIDHQIVRKILNGEKVNTKSTNNNGHVVATVSDRAFLCHWSELISIPKMGTAEQGKATDEKCESASSDSSSSDSLYLRKGSGVREEDTRLRAAWPSGVMNETTKRSDTPPPVKLQRKVSQNTEPNDEPDTFVIPNRRSNRESEWDGSGILGATTLLVGIGFAIGMFFGKRSSR